MIKVFPSANMQTDFQPVSQTESNLSHVLTLAAHSGDVVRLSSKILARKLTSIQAKEPALHLYRRYHHPDKSGGANLQSATLPTFAIEDCSRYYDLPAQLSDYKLFMWLSLSARKEPEACSCLLHRTKGAIVRRVLFYFPHTWKLLPMFADYYSPSDRESALRHGALS